jgi:hypothetical protein
MVRRDGFVRRGDGGRPWIAARSDDRRVVQAAWGFLADFTVDAACHSLRFAWVPSVERWSLLDRALRGHYAWCEVFREGDRPVGFWRRVSERR